MARNHAGSGLRRVGIDSCNPKRLADFVPRPRIEAYRCKKPPIRQLNQTFGALAFHQPALRSLSQLAQSKRLLKQIELPVIERNGPYGTRIFGETVLESALDRLRTNVARP